MRRVGGSSATTDAQGDGVDHLRQALIRRSRSGRDAIPQFEGDQFVAIRTADPPLLAQLVHRYALAAARRRDLYLGEDLNDRTNGFSLDQLSIREHRAERGLDPELRHFIEGSQTLRDHLFIEEVLAQSDFSEQEVPDSRDRLAAHSMSAHGGRATRAPSEARIARVRPVNSAYFLLEVYNIN